MSNVFWNCWIRMISKWNEFRFSSQPWLVMGSASIYKLNFVLKCKLNLVIVAHVDSDRFVPGSWYEKRCFIFHQRGFFAFRIVPVDKHVNVDQLFTKPWSYWFFKTVLCRVYIRIKRIVSRDRYLFYQYFLCVRGWCSYLFMWYWIVNFLYLLLCKYLLILKILPVTLFRGSEAAILTTEIDTIE